MPKEITLQCPKCEGKCIFRTAQRIGYEIVFFGKCYDCDIPLKWPMSDIEEILLPELKVSH